MFHFTKCLIEDGHPWENCRVAAGKIPEDGARCSVTTNEHRHTAGNQRRQKIAETVGVRDWDDAEIQINIGNPHRVANLIAIGQ